MTTTSSSRWSTTIPPQVKWLFEKFPLKEYGSELQVPQYENDKKYALLDKLGNNDGMSSTFQLGVYNVCGYSKDADILLPTDPICLSCQLIINLRNGLCFPHKGQSAKKQTQNFISVVSYRASYDNQLPMFIEQVSASGKRVVNSTTLINDLQMTRTTQAQLMKCLAVDTVLYDFWLITVLFELDPQLQSEIYLSATVQQDPVLCKLILRPTLSSLLARFGFDNRNPNVAKHFDEANWALSSHHQQELIKAERELVLSKSKELLQLLESSLVGKQFLNNDKPHPGILDCKLAAVVYSVIRFGSNTKFGHTIQDFPNIVRHSFEVIEKSL